MRREKKKNTLPNNWITLPLGDISNSQKGKLPKEFSTCLKEGFLPYIDIKAFEKNEIRRYAKIEKSVISTSKDILVVWDGARFGLSGFGCEGVLGSTLVRINSDYLETKFLYYFIHNNYKIINSKPRGTGTPHVDPETFWSLSVNIAPLNEQKRIVDKIEQLFSDLDKGEDLIKTIQKQLKTYRQSVLNSFFDYNKFENSEKLENLTIKVGSGSTPKGGKKSYKSEGIPLIRSMNIHFGFFKYKGLAFIDDIQAKALNNVVVEEHDVLLNITGASIGRVTTAPIEMEGARVNQHVCIIRCKKDLLSSKFLYLFLSSPLIQNKIFLENYGATRQALTKRQILNIDIPLPRIDQQLEISEKILNTISKIDVLEKWCNEALIESRSLRQSILKSAFSGQLVPQDPNDEPVINLLERIKAKKQQLENNKLCKKTTKPTKRKN